MIDMHTHWRPAEFTDALRARTTEPRVVRNQAGVEVLKTRMGEEPLSKAFDEADFHLARMNRQGVSTSVLSLLGSFCWIEAQPLDVSLPLCRLFNDSVSRLCQEHDGRFAAYAALPLVDIAAAAAEFERALGLPGIVGTQVPGNAFLTRKDAEAMRPVLEVANRHRALVFIHHGPRPGDTFPKVAGDTDNARRRNGTLDMQASLSRKRKPARKRATRSGIATPPPCSRRSPRSRRSNERRRDDEGEARLGGRRARTPGHGIGTGLSMTTSTSEGPPRSSAFFRI